MPDEMSAKVRMAERGLKAWQERYGDDQYPYRLDTQCQTGKCHDLATHATTYRYVTGRAGRTTSRFRIACAKHAEAFAAKNGITVQEESS